MKKEEHTNTTVGLLAIQFLGSLLYERRSRNCPCVVHFNNSQVKGFVDDNPSEAESNANGVSYPRGNLNASLNSERQRTTSRCGLAPCSR